MESDGHQNGDAAADEPVAELTVKDLFATIGRLEVTRAALAESLATTERENAGLRAIVEAQHRRLQVLEPDPETEPQPR